ncbi:MAG TPA: hypothetical protein VFO77_03745 [Actinoplanes sp.]|nr:hypothetical protein [Actinoplanes sp.]
MEPIGDPDDETGDFAEEHQNTEVTEAEKDDDGEPESVPPAAAAADR